MNITRQSIKNAHELITPYIHRTPILTSESLNRIYGCELFFKCENFQKIGAFKIRGAMNTALNLDKETLMLGLATHSSGNHAQAIAYTAKMLGTKAYIVMPENSARVKVDAVRGYGAEIIFCEPNQQARETELKKVTDRTGAYFIHPYEDERIITGQATCAKEFFEDITDIDTVIAPVGGGGLLAGTVLSAVYFGNDCRVIAAEPEGAADTELSIRNGHVTKANYINTIADGLLTTIGQLNFNLIKEKVEQVVTVSDEEIISALKMIFERLKIVIEPSSAVVLASLIKIKEQLKGQRVGLILSGGNIDLLKFKEWLK